MTEEQPRQLTYFQSSGTPNEPEFVSSIRRTDHEGTTYFSLVDMMSAFADSENEARVYWSQTKKRLERDGFELYSKMIRLKLTASDGKQRLTDVADRETCLRIIQSIPSPKAEPVRQWLASLGEREFQDIADPVGGLKRAERRAVNMLQYVHGMSHDEAVEQVEFRRDMKVTRKLLMAALTTVCVDPVNFGHFTNVEYEALFNRTARELKTLVNSNDFRTATTPVAQQAIESAENTCKAIFRSVESIPFEDACDIMRQSAEIARQLIELYEQRTGRSGITGRPLSED